MEIKDPVHLLGGLETALAESQARNMCRYFGDRV